MPTLSDTQRREMLKIGLKPLGKLLQKVIDTEDDDILLDGNISDYQTGVEACLW